LAMRWALLLLFVPLALAAELDDFLSARPAVPVTVECQQTYMLYAYRSNGAIDYVIVARGGEPVFDFKTYRQAVSAYLYKEHLSRFAGDVRLLTPSAVPAFSQLLSRLRDEEYELSVARKYSEECFPQFVSQIDTLESVRGKLVEEGRNFISVLSSEAERLVEYLKSHSVSCGFTVNTDIYDDLTSIVELMNTYESYSKQLRASIATAETNCTPHIVQAITSSLKPPFSSEQLQYFITSSATEREVFSYRPSDEEVRALLQKSMREYWKTLYEERMKEPVETPFGSFPLQEAVQYILSANVPWEREDMVRLLRGKYDEVVRLAASGEYEEAYKGASDLRTLVVRIFRAGVKTKEGLEVPAWAYGVVIILAGVILWKRLGRRGGDEEEPDDLDYGYDYA